MCPSASEQATPQAYLSAQPQVGAGGGHLTLCATGTIAASWRGAEWPSCICRASTTTVLPKGFEVKADCPVHALTVYCVLSSPLLTAILNGLFGEHQGQKVHSQLPWI